MLRHARRRNRRPFAPHPTQTAHHFQTEKPRFFFTPESYGRYLHTPHFLGLVKRMFPKGRIGRCTVCFQRNVFLVPHHRGYECIGKEKIGRDLIKVCKRCNYELTFRENGTKTPPTRVAYLAREKYLKMRNKSVRFKVGQVKLGDVVNKAASGTGKFLKAIW